MTLAQLRQQVVEQFSESELRDLCFDLEVDYDALAGQSKNDRARELILHFARRGDLSPLLDACRTLRPGSAWPGLTGTATPEAPPPPDRPWWQDLAADRGGDVIVAQVGSGARGVAVGKNIEQQFTDDSAEEE
jgi:hypothetical protein